MPKDSKTRRGRPAGSRNAKYANAIHIPPTCPKCGSTELNAVKGSRPIEREISGKLPSGFEYVAVKWQRCQCACGQHVTVKTYFPGKNNIADIITAPTEIDSD